MLDADYQLSIYATIELNGDPWGTWRISRISTGQISLLGKDPLVPRYPYFADSSGGNATDI